MNKLRTPDFIIGGAPKCATTSLHAILAQHPDVGIPRDEIHFFDADDPLTHYDFFRMQDGLLRNYDPDEPDGPLYRAYLEKFCPFLDRKVIGEDSTTYIFSAVAPTRIKRMLPEVRLIFMLRDPVARAYSQYWHLVATGRATASFEQSLVDWPNIILGSTYRDGLARYLELFGAEQVRVVLFEDFVANTQAGLNDITDYLGVARFDVPEVAGWANRSSFPANSRRQFLLNRVGSWLNNGRYQNLLGSRGPEEKPFSRRLRGFAARKWKKLTALGLSEPKAPPMKGETRAYLTRHLSERNRGLSELLGRDLSVVWKDFKV